MKRTPLTRKTPLRPGPSTESKRLGGLASVETRRVIAGIPTDSLTNKHGQSCAELICSICQKPFLAQWSTRFQRKTCSVRCAAELKKTNQTSRNRTGVSNPNFRGGQRSGVRDRAGERRWYAALGDSCAHPSCPGTVTVLALHHTIYRQKLAREGGDLYDPRNGLTICSSCHSSHHRRGSRIVPLSALLDANYDFAYEFLGVAAYDYLRLRYAGVDPRLDSLLTR